MRAITILAAITMLAICGGAMALSITILGTVYGPDGQPLQAVWELGPNWDYENIGLNPLVELNVNGAMVAQTTVGAGQYVLPVNGMFSKSLDIAAGLGDVLTVTAYLGPTATGPSAISAGLTVNVITGGTPADYIYDFGTTNIIPEPSILLTGLVLFLIRRKK
jgi:hypothetical protein